MLYSSGMCFGIVFYGVAEPFTHFSIPPDAEPRSVQAARDAMEVTFFHWGVHAWEIYAVIGLALAYFGYRRGLPLVIRTAFHPNLRDRLHGTLGDLIDIYAVVATRAGIVTHHGLACAPPTPRCNNLLGLT